MWKLVKVSTALGALAVALLLGMHACDEWEARRTRDHDRKTDSLTAATRQATEQLAVVDTEYVDRVETYTRWRTRIDTVRVPQSTRDCVRLADSVVSSCERRRLRSDSLVAALRRELEHAQLPRPTPRRSFHLRAGYDVVTSAWRGEGGVAYRLFGPVEAYSTLSLVSDSASLRGASGALVVGTQITFR